MVAVFIFAISITTIIGSMINSSLNFNVTKQETLAALLAQHIMVQAEANFETKKFEEGEEKDSGQGEGVFAPYKWTWTLKEIPFELPSIATLLQGTGKEEEMESAEAEKILLLTKLLNENLKKVFRELSVEVTWTPYEGSKPRTYTLTTHLVDLTVAPTFPGIPGAGGGTGTTGGGGT